MVVAFAVLAGACTLQLPAAPMGGPGLPASQVPTPAPTAASPRPVVTYHSGPTWPPSGPPSPVASSLEPSPGAAYPTPSATPAAALFEAYFSATWGTSDAANEATARSNAGNPEKQLAALIARATQTVDAAVAELSEPGLVAALVAAERRGVTVRVVTDSDSWEDPQDSTKPAPPFKTLQDAGIAVVPDQRSAIMHDKFVVVDGREVWTGSFNLTENAAFKQNNNAVRMASAALAANFATEFQEMFETHKFGVTSPAGVPNPVVGLGAASVETLFAPEDKVGNRLVAQIRAASRSIRFMAFSFTHDAMGLAMMEAASAGIDVAGVIEKTNANGTGGEYPKLKAAGLDVRLDGNPSFMHHKVIVLDADTVITGSFNFSASADTSNDENVVIVRGAPDLAARYLAEYDRVRAAAIAAGN